VPILLQTTKLCWCYFAIFSFVQI